MEEVFKQVILVVSIVIAIGGAAMVGSVLLKEIRSYRRSAAKMQKRHEKELAEQFATVLALGGALHSTRRMKRLGPLRSVSERWKRQRSQK